MTHFATNLGIIPAAIALVSSKSFEVMEDTAYLTREAVIITDPHFIINGFNDVAGAVFGFTSKAAPGRQLFSLVQIEMIGTNFNIAAKKLFTDEHWKGDIVYNHGAKKINFSILCNLIKDGAGLTISIVISARHIEEKLKKEKVLATAENEYQTLVDSLSEGVMLINANGTIDAANKTAKEIFGLTHVEITGKIFNSTNWKITKEDGSEFPIVDYPATVTLQTGLEKNNVVMGVEHSDGTNNVWISVNSRAVFDEKNILPVAVVISFIEIGGQNEINDRLAVSESLFRNFMKDSPTLGWILDEDGMLVYGNPRFLDIIGLAAGTTGINILGFINQDEVLATIEKRNKEVLQYGKTIIKEESITDIDGITRHYLTYWFLLPVKNNKKLIGGHAVEITDKIRAEKETDKMYERYQYAINASSDAIWDMDITNGAIYLSDTFSLFSGYSKAEIVRTVDWLFEKIHPQDKERIKVNVANCISKNAAIWENEYRFRAADGSYKDVLDKAKAVYEDGKVIRVIGAMQDITERKMLEMQLLQEQVQKQKLINQATIRAQEKERNRISGELHDNVNQLLMSAKLHICVAKSKGDGPPDLLDKANEYLIMAVEEIRELSKGLTSVLITSIGLQKSISNIASTMLLLQNIQLHIYISNGVIGKLSPEQQLMVYRIIQEQSNNILKYAEPKNAIISLKEVDQQIELIISDDGKGFNKQEQTNTGIGFINIFNRVDAYNGKADIITSPGNGCTLIISFPMAEL